MGLILSTSNDYGIIGFTIRICKVISTSYKMLIRPDSNMETSVPNFDNRSLIFFPDNDNSSKLSTNKEC